MGIKLLFDKISKNEGVSVDEIARKLGVAKSTIYYSIKKDELSLKLHKAIKQNYPKYAELTDIDNIVATEYDPVKVVDYIINNESDLMTIDKFRLWLKTKVQDGVIEVLSSDKS